jgi:DNA-binding winged helix-turn-helix (wHTH) protein
LRYLFEDCALDTDARELCRGTSSVSVEPQVFDLLVYLIRNRDRVVSKDDLIASIWHGRIVSESTLNTRISAARFVIGDNGEDQRLIKTWPRKGIRFVGIVREEQRSPYGGAGVPLSGRAQDEVATPPKPWLDAPADGVPEHAHEKDSRYYVPTTSAAEAVTSDRQPGRRDESPAAPPAPAASQLAVRVSEAERRHLTIMACGLVDLSALAARLEPEDLHEVIAAHYRCVRQVVLPRGVG